MVRKTLVYYALCIAFASWQTSASRGDVKLNPLFSEGMVLQQGMRVPVWGTAASGEKVTVRFRGQEVSALPEKGKWMVHLEKLDPGGPFEMTVEGRNKFTFKNVLVGDVWICSGQSNMEMTVRSSADFEKNIAQSKNPRIRLFTVAKNPSITPQDRLGGGWSECNPDTVGGFSAVAYFFGRDLERAQQIPIGLIHTSWGGTPAEAWTSREALSAEPSLKYMVDNTDRDVAAYPKEIEKHIQALQQYHAKTVEALAKHHDIANPPNPPINWTKYAWGANSLYNGMIHPLLPYAITGAIWYQGESNAGRAFEYRTLLATMITDWRKAWGQGDFPFLIVQLAPFQRIKPEPGESDWAELREAQLLMTKKLPKVGIAVITDVGHETDIHPVWKEPVGARLALAARALAHDEKIVYSGPVYREMKIDGDRAILSFDHVGGGLVAKDGPVVGFTIADEDHVFVKADAEIQGDQVIVRSSQVKSPVAVRYGWAAFPVVNLTNKEGLPATPFRTDDFRLTTQRTAGQ
ncbi:MAG TPA: sialate O-acetylesterase [Gemmataceae bacterium]|nr:sialate O-acetylesterase [Gemmataceae bacterium]